MLCGSWGRDFLRGTQTWREDNNLVHVTRCIKKSVVDPADHDDRAISCLLKLSKLIEGTSLNRSILHEHGIESAGWVVLELP